MLPHYTQSEVGKMELILETAIYKADTIEAINRHQSSSKPYVTGIKQLHRNLENIAEAEAKGEKNMIYHDMTAAFMLDMFEDLY